MPHIKVTPFRVDLLESIPRKDSIISFRAVEEFSSSDSKPKTQTELLGIEFEGDSFVLELHKRIESYLIKPEKSTRPLDVNRIKKALALVAKEAKLEILHDNIALSATRPPLANEFNKTIEDFVSPDFGGRKIAIEVGFGSGRHLLHQANKNPDILYIGIEIHTPSAQQVLKQIELQKLTNIWVVNYDARLLLEMLPSNVAKMIYVHFPVPWDKKPHRRVIGDLFLEESIRVLEPSGTLELRTDSDNYYAYALEIFSRPSKVFFSVEKNSEADVRSKYEDRWRRQEKDIYTLSFRAEEESKPLNNNYNFSFDGVCKGISELLSLPPKAILESNHFVHFESRYRLSSGDGVIIKCSFGSFDRPEHKLLLIRSGEAVYYPQPPVASATNSDAHQTIKRYIYV